MDKDEIKYDDTIQQYLKGKLSLAERNAIEQKMTTNPIFNNLVRRHQVAIKAVEHAAEEDLKAQLIGLEEIEEPIIAPPAPIIPLYIKRVLSIAATVLLLVIGYNYYFIPEPVNPVAGLEEILEERGSLSTVLGTEDYFNEAKTAYNKGTDEKALGLIEQYLAAETEDLEPALYVKGRILRHLGRLAEAEKILLELTEKESFEKEAAHFELALIYAERGEMDAAKKQLTNIKMGNDLKQKATMLLKIISN